MPSCLTVDTVAVLKRSRCNTYVQWTCQLLSTWTIDIFYEYGWTIDIFIFSLLHGKVYVHYVCSFINFIVRIL